jgi:pimeloyl-ACP methyl ester carboxylesterase
MIPNREWAQNFLPWVLTDGAYAVPGLIDQVIQMNVQNPDRPSAELLQAQAAAIVGSDTSNRLAKLKMPTLVAVGEQDILTPASYSREINREIGGSAFDLLPGGHGFIAENAPELAKRVSAFLRAHPFR